MKDGWIGLFNTTMHLTEPLITSCNIQIDESMDNAGEFRSLTNAQISITDLDIHPDSPRGIYTIVIELAKVYDEKEYLVQNFRVPKEWIVIDSHNLSEELTGSNNTISITVKNIPAHVDGYYHKFRISFLASDGTRARLHFGNNTDKVVCEVIERRLIGETIIAGDISGFSIEAYSGNQLVSVSPIPALVQDGATLYMPSDTALKAGYQFSDVNAFAPADDFYFYAFGIEGKGEVFNGIDDFSEIYGALDVMAQIHHNVTNTYADTVWVEDDDSVVVTTQDSVNLQCRNMYDHPDVTLIKADGTNVLFTNQQSKTIDYYSIFMYQSKTAPAQNKYPGPDPNGVWALYDEIPAPKVSRSLMPFIKTTIQDVPEMTFYSFFIGFRTKRSTMPEGVTNQLTMPEPMDYPVGGVNTGGSADISSELTI